MKNYFFKFGVISFLGIGQVFAIVPNEETYKHDARNHYYVYSELVEGYVPLSYNSIDQFIRYSNITDWLGFGIRAFKPTEITDDYWVWKIPVVKYKGLNVIGVYRGVCNKSGDDGCGWAGTTGLIFEENEDQVKLAKLELADNRIIGSYDFLDKERGVIAVNAEDGEY